MKRRLTYDEYGKILVNEWHSSAPEKDIIREGYFYTPIALEDGEHYVKISETGADFEDDWEIAYEDYVFALLGGTPR